MAIINLIAFGKNYFNLISNPKLFLTTSSGYFFSSFLFSKIFVILASAITVSRLIFSFLFSATVITGELTVVEEVF